MRSKVLGLCLVVVAVYLVVLAAMDKPALVDVQDRVTSPQPSRSGVGARGGPIDGSAAVDSRLSLNGVAAGQAGAGADPVRERTNLQADEVNGDDETVWEPSLHEDHSVYASEPTQQFCQWRRVLADEVPDPAWGEQLRRDLTRRAHGGLLADAEFHQIDCRETMCQLYLQTVEPRSTQALFAAMRRDRLEIEYQEMAAHVQLEGASRGGTTFELVLRRDRPASMSAHVPGAGPAYRAALDAREAEDE